MKKHYFLLILCALGLFGNLRAQNTITIGEGTESGYAIADNYSGHGASQQIYTSGEIAAAGGSAGTITKIAFNKRSGANYDRTWSVYLKNTADESFSISSSKGMTKDPGTLVYDDTFKTPDGWVTFDIEDFQYDGSNLLVTIVDNSGNPGGDQNWYYTNLVYIYPETTTCNTLTLYAESNIDITSSRSFSAFGGRFNIRLTFESNSGPTTPPAKPTGLTATNITQNSVTLSWNAVDGATNYKVYSVENGNYTELKNIPGTSSTIIGLSAETQYTFAVTAVNLGGESAKAEVNATTKSKPTMIDFDKYYRIKVNSATGNGEYLTIFNYDRHKDGPKGGVGVATKETNRNQIFKFESAGNDNVYLRSAHDNGNERYIYCQKWNVDAINNSDKSVLGVHPLNDGLFYLTDYYYNNILGKENQYFKVESVAAANYVFSDAPIGDAATWSLEEVTVPSAPTIQATDVTYNSISLSWDAVNGAESYNVYKDNVFVESILGTTYTATGLASETEYCFAVEAVNVSGASAKSASACATTTAVLAPSAPTNLTATAINEYSIRLEWKAVDAAESYNVYKSGSLIAQGIKVSYYINSGLLPGTNHCYTVTSFNATNGESVVHSEEACETTVALPAPDAPENLTATVNGTSSIILDWTAVGSASSYNVYMNGSLATSLLSTTYTATGLEAGTNYCFVVKAVNMGGESDESDEVCKITVPAAPVLYARANTQTIITLSWETVKGATSYNVYRDDAFITNITGTTLNEENLAAGTTRSYTITAVNESGESAKSNVATATTLSEGQQEIVIGNSDTENFMIPVHLRNNFSFSQQIYTKDELDFGFRGLITKLTFTQTEDTKDISCYRIVKIYMTNTDQDSFVKGVSPWVQLTDATLVYEGRFDMGTGNPIIEIVFNKEPFVYLGSNILLTVQTSSKNYNDIQQIQSPNPIPRFCGYTSPTCKTLFTYSDGQYVIDPSYWGDKPSYSNFNNTVNFTIEPAGLIYRGRGNWNETAKWLNGYLPKPTDDVYILGRAAITNSVDVNYMVIPDTSIVTLETGTLTVTDKIVNSNENSFVFHDGTQVFQNGEDVKATFKMQIDQPTVWEESHKEGWQFIASPVKNASTSSFETATGDYDLYKYDRTKADEEWRNYKNHPADGAEPFDKSFVQGRGYLASYETEETASFAGTLSHEKSFTFEADTYEDGKHYENFYLLGNPFPFDMNLANMSANGVYTGYATMTSNGTYQYLGTDGTVKVGDGFFVLANAANPTVSYTHNARSSRGCNESLNLVVSSNEGYDNVIINLSDENNDGFPKLENFNDEVSELYLLEDDVRYAIMNYNKDVKEVELRFAPKKMGNYTIEAVTNKTTPFNTIILIDRFTGIETNLLMEDYKFTATANDASQRFIVRFAEDEYNNEKSFVFQSGDDLIINGTGTVQIIDVMGRVVYSDAVESTNNRINVAALKKAAYMVRCIEGNQVKTQKIVVL